MDFVLKEVPLPVRLRPQRPMNGEEFLRFCADNSDVRIELEPDGEILVMSPVGSVIGAAELEIGAQLLAWAKADGRGKVFGPSTGFTLPNKSVRMPDAAWVSFERWFALTEQQRTKCAPVCPEFVIEICSASDRLSLVQAKMEMWIANGTQVAWMIDPERGDVTIYRSGAVPEVHHKPSSVHGSGPVAGFELIMD